MVPVWCLFLLLACIQTSGPTSTFLSKHSSSPAVKFRPPIYVLHPKAFCFKWSVTEQGKAVFFGSTCQWITHYKLLLSVSTCFIQSFSSIQPQSSHLLPHSPSRFKRNSSPNFITTSSVVVLIHILNRILAVHSITGSLDLFRPLTFSQSTGDFDMAVPLSLLMSAGLWKTLT